VASQPPGGLEIGVSLLVPACVWDTQHTIHSVPSAKTDQVVLNVSTLLFCRG